MTDFSALVAGQRQYFNSGATGPVAGRKEMLRRLRDGQTFALFRWEIPAWLYSHFEVQLECGDGQTISAFRCNVIDRDSAFCARARFL